VSAPKFGSGYGAWSRFKSQFGLKQASNPDAVSGYILERKLTKTIKKDLTPEVLREIARKYKLKKYYMGEKGSKKIRERIDQIRFKITSMSTIKLQEAFEVYDEKGVIECLLFINKNHPLIFEKQISQTTIFDDDYEEC